MKKLTLLLGAVALLGLASCNEQIEMPSNNGAKKGEVVSSMTINIATKANTKATATEVQDGTAFRGMEKMSLFVSKTDLTTNDFTPNFVYDLGSLGAGEISASKSSKVYQLTMPVGINSMAFYGKATKASGASDKQFGKMDFTVGTSKQGTYFQQSPIVTDQGVAFNTAANALAEILNDVIAADGWADLAEAAETAIDITAIPLRDAYKELTTIQPGEVRAGSAAAVQSVLDTLKAICTSINKTTSLAPPTVKAVAAAILNEIPSSLGVDATFPCNLGLPAGAAQLTFDGAFSYVASPEAMGSGNGVALGKFAFPVELAYWAVSPIRVTSEEVAESNYPVTVAAWDADDSWTAKNWTKNGTVTASTKGVALQNNINYGTALLKSTVKVAAPSSESTTTKASTSTISDNRNAIQTRIYGAANAEPDQAIAITDGMFELVGILVGGQPGRVGWDWTPASGVSFDNVVYDTYFGSETVEISSTATDPLYTMVFDNRVNGDAQNDVMVALELKNKTGKAFYGNANVIPADGIFYLVGTFDISEASTASVAKQISDLIAAGYYYPYSSKYSVFMQDFVTSANFTITSLKGAYSTVPDLRSAEMKFGLSVDLSWKAGLSFDVELK